MQQYDTQQCLYTLKRILMILKAEGRAFICATATTSMNVCNTPHQNVLRQLLIRHKRVLSGKDFYGPLVEGNTPFCFIWLSKVIKRHSYKYKTTSIT